MAAAAVAEGLIANGKLSSWVTKAMLVLDGNNRGSGVGLVSIDVGGNRTVITDPLVVSQSCTGQAWFCELCANPPWFNNPHSFLLSAAKNAE